jgi:hypothetical protein
MSKQVKAIIPDLLYLWLKKEAESEDKTDSAMIRKCVKAYLGQRFGKETIKTPPED